MEILVSNKGKDLIGYNGYLYRKDKKRTYTLNWRCVKDGCKGRLTTSLDYQKQIRNNEIPVETGEHAHPPDPVGVQVKKIENRVTHLASSTTQAPRQIVQSVIDNASQEVAQRVGSALNLRETVRRKRRADDAFPRNPQHRRDINIPPALRRTLKGEDFLKYDSGMEDDHRILIFSTDEMINVLAQNPQWMADGTFKIAPSIFYQLYTIHAILQENLVPCVYALLPDKREETYRDMLTALIHIQPLLHPVSCLIDFELASKNAFLHIFPGIEIVGCFFHLGQSVWRKVAAEGLQNAYINEELIRKNIKMLMALAFLPTRDVSDGFMQIIEAENFPEMLQPVMDYFEDTYIGRPQRNRRRNPSFPPHMWNVLERTLDGLPRTNNMLEAWHGVMQRSLQAKHPTILKFIQLLQKEQALQEFNLIQIRGGRDITRRLKKYLIVNKRLARVIQNRHAYRTLDYLSAIGGNLELNIN